MNNSKDFEGLKAAGSEKNLLLKPKLIPRLAPVDERPELPPDSKVKMYGRYPEFAVAVRLDYIEDPKDMLKELAEFIFKYAGNPNYDEEKKDLW